VPSPSNIKVNYKLINELNRHHSAGLRRGSGGRKA
jgi:hypothetical protein